MALGDLPWVTGDGDLEDRLGDIDRDGSRVHRAPPSGVMPAKATWHCDADPFAGGVHPIACSGQGASVTLPAAATRAPEAPRLLNRYFVKRHEIPRGERARGGI
jgi:hypothetical protein